jgi:probable O-glycosylation ligase (exosortase A-associated)
MSAVQPSQHGAVQPWPRRRGYAAPAPAVPGPMDVSPPNFLHGVEWSISFAGLLLYIVIITTYRIGFGEFVIGTALAGLVIERRVRAPAPVFALFVLVAWAYLGALSTNWPGVVRTETLALLKVALIALVAASTLNSPQRVRLLLLVFILAYALYPARGALFNYFGGYSLRGRAIWNYTYRNPNDLAALTLLQVSIATGLYVTEPRGWTKRGALAAMIVLPCLILLTGSRAGFLGLAVFGLFLFAAYRQKLRLVALALGVAIAAALVVPSETWDRLGMVRTLGAGGTEALSEIDDMGSAELRYRIWTNAFAIARQNPLHGVGWGAYPRANERHDPEIGAKSAHSTPLAVSAEVGVPGLALFISIIGLTLLRGRRARARLRELRPNAAQQIRMMELGLIAYLVAGIFGSFQKLTFLYLHMVLIWALAETYAPEFGPASTGAVRRVAHRRTG